MISFLKEWWHGVKDCWTLFGFVTLMLIPLIPIQMLWERYETWRHTPSRMDTLCLIYDKTHHGMQERYVPDGYTLAVLQQLQREELLQYRAGIWRTTSAGDSLVSEWMNDEI